jgi:SAM-dependent methyltransferase
VVAAVPGVEVWGVDFSEGMLARARQKVPDLRLIRAERDRALPRLALPPFGAVVSSYVLHELLDERKVALIEHVLGERLVPGGVLAIGDIAFADEAHRTAVRRAVGGRWDESERYVVADALLAGLGARGITPARLPSGVVLRGRPDRPSCGGRCGRPAPGLTDRPAALDGRPAAVCLPALGWSGAGEGSAAWAVRCCSATTCRSCAGWRPRASI